MAKSKSLVQETMAAEQDGHETAVESAERQTEALAAAANGGDSGFNLQDADHATEDLTDSEDDTEVGLEPRKAKVRKEQHYEVFGQRRGQTDWCVLAAFPTVGRMRKFCESSASVLARDYGALRVTRVVVYATIIL